MKQVAFLLLGAFLFCGCTMNADHMGTSVNGSRGAVYTPLYDYGGWLRNPGEIGIVVQTEHYKPVGVFYGLQRYFGALPISDFDAKGVNFGISPANYSTNHIRLKISSIQNLSKTNETIAVNRTLEMPPKTVAMIDLNPIDISNFGIQIDLQISYEMDGIPGSQDISLKRRTQSELEKIKKTQEWGYPWQVSPKK